MLKRTVPYFQINSTTASIAFSAGLLLMQLACTSKNSETTDNTKSDSTETVATNTNTASEVAINTLTEKEKEDGWILLFDGESTDSWRGYNSDQFPDKGWQIQDNLLMVEASGTGEDGFGGDIITKDQFEDFEFKVDFKLSPQGNSGIVYLVKEEENTPSWHSAPEYQLLDNQYYEENGDIPMDKHRTGDAYDIKAATEDAMNPVGEWNEAMIRVKDGNVEHWLNGKKVVEYSLQSPEWKQLVEKSKFADYPAYGMAEKGHIGIQDHGHQLWYRNIKVRQL